MFVIAPRGQAALVSALAALVCGAALAGCGVLDEETACGEVGSLIEKRADPVLASTESIASIESIDDTSGVFGGTEQPTSIPLTPGQVLAVGSFAICSGTLIADDWVLTARHCPIVPGNVFCLGEEPGTPNLCIAVERSIEHPDADARLIQLAVGANSVLPAVEPVPPLTEALDCSWVGEMAEAAGYGQTEAGTLGTRLFTAEPIVTLTPGFVRIHGRGRAGLCGGDSGGPAFVVASDGSVRIAGALSVGHLTCRQFDDFTRADLLAGWIADVTGHAF